MVRGLIHLNRKGDFVMLRKLSEAEYSTWCQNIPVNQSGESEWKTKVERLEEVINAYCKVLIEEYGPDYFEEEDSDSFFDVLDEYQGVPIVAVGIFVPEMFKANLLEELQGALNNPPLGFRISIVPELYEELRPPILFEIISKRDDGILYFSGDSEFPKGKPDDPIRAQRVADILKLCFPE